MIYIFMGAEGPLENEHSEEKDAGPRSAAVRATWWPVDDTVRLPWGSGTKERMHGRVHEKANSPVCPQLWAYAEK